MKVTVEKAKEMVFDSGLVGDNRPEVQTKIISEASSYKYLGVLIGSSLT